MSKPIKDIESWIDNGFHSKRGIGIKKRTLFALVGTLIMIGFIASAGLISTFLTINTEITVNNTNILIDDNNAPWTIQSSFSNKLPGNIWNESHYINNTKSGCYYLINFTSICDTGLTAILLNSTHEQITQVNVTGVGSELVYIEYELDLLADVGTYNATINFDPLGAGVI